VPRRDGHEWFLSAPTFGIALDSVDAESHVLHGVAIVTEGPALGHGVSLDEEFVADVVKQSNATRTGLKSRFGHPTMSSTALGTFLGRAKHLRLDHVDGKAVARGDLFLSSSAADAPGGDLREYVEQLAADDPAAFGMSLAFEAGDIYRRTEDGKKVFPGQKDFNDTPGPDYIGLDELLAADAVDDPAANPSGLFSAWHRETLAGQVSEFLDYHPEVFALMEEHPEVLEKFLVRYRAYRARKGATMADTTDDVVEELEQTLEAETVDDEAAEPAPETGTDTPEPEAETPSEEEEPKPDEAPVEEPLAADPQNVQAAAKPYVTHFGDRGARLFLEGKSFEEAVGICLAEREEQHQAALEAKDEQLAAKAKEVADLQERIRQFRAAAGDEDPVPPSPEPSEEDDELKRLTATYERQGLTTEEAEAKALDVVRKREQVRDAG